MKARVAVSWCLAAIVLSLMTGCGKGKEEAASGDEASFVVYGSAKGAERDEGVQVLKKENQTIKGEIK